MTDRTADHIESPYPGGPNRALCSGRQNLPDTIAWRKIRELAREQVAATFDYQANLLAMYELGACGECIRAYRARNT